MIPRPPRSTRTDTLFPYTTLFRSAEATAAEHLLEHQGDDDAGNDPGQDGDGTDHTAPEHRLVEQQRRQQPDAELQHDDARSEERRVGNRCVSTIRTRRSTYHEKNNT